MISARLKQFLDDNGAAYTVVQHDPAFTAQQLAARMHVPGREFVGLLRFSGHLTNGEIYGCSNGGEEET